MIKYKIYPSSSGFMDETSYEVEYNSSCFRYLLVAQGIKTDIDPIYRTLGALHEDWYFEQNKDLILEREKPLEKIYGTVKYSGRVDFIMKNGEIHETKASISKNFLYSTIRKKQVKLSHLAQLVSYLIHSEVPKGKIIAGYYKILDKEKMEFELKETCEFTVEITDEGKILVNGIQHKYTVYDSIRYVTELVKTLEKQEVGKRPMSINKWSNPCTYCKLRENCDKLDLNTITKDEFKNTSIQILKELK